MINRGGEIIPPVDVEDALLSSPVLPNGGRVLSCLAFAWPHATLQEVVGLALVMCPDNPRRPSLPELCQHLSPLLHAAKWPQGIVFLDALPRGATGKPQRIQLASRCSLPELTDATSPRHRLFEAKVPPPGSGLDVPLHCTPIDAGLSTSSHALPIMTTALETYPGVREATTHVRVESSAIVAYVSVDAGVTVEGLRGGLAIQGLHGYLWPDRLVLLTQRPLPRDHHGGLDWAALVEEDKRQVRLAMEQRGPEGELCQLFGEALGLGPETVVGADQDFFAMGGDSHRAGKLVSLIRRRLGVSLPVHALYSAGTATRLRHVIREHQQQQEAAPDQPAKGTNVQPRSRITGAGGLPTSPVLDDEAEEEPAVANEKQDRPLALVLQLVPLAVLHPLVRISTLVVFMAALVEMERHQQQRLATQGIVHTHPPVLHHTHRTYQAAYRQYVATMLRVTIALACSCLYSQVPLLTCPCPHSMPMR